MTIYIVHHYESTPDEYNDYSRSYFVRLDRAVAIAAEKAKSRKLPATGPKSSEGEFVPFSWGDDYLFEYIDVVEIDVQE